MFHLVIALALIVVAPTQKPEKAKKPDKNIPASVTIAAPASEVRKALIEAFLDATYDFDSESEHLLVFSRPFDPDTTASSRVTVLCVVLETSGVSKVRASIQMRGSTGLGWAILGSFNDLFKEPVQKLLDALKLRIESAEKPKPEAAQDSAP